MKVGDLVKQVCWEGLGLVTCIDPEEIGDQEEVLVSWSNGDLMNHSTKYLEVMSEGR